MDNHHKYLFATSHFSLMSAVYAYKKHNMFRIIIGPYPTQVMAQVDVVSLNNKLNEKNEKNTPYVVRLSKWCQNSQLDKSNNFFECK